MSDENQNQLQVAERTHERSPALFSTSGFEMAQRMATALSKSTLIPENFRNNLPNCLIALEMAQRMGASPMMVMQNLYVVHGRPAWSSQFVIAALNSTKRFSPLRFEITGEGQTRECYAWAVELATGERLEGPAVNMTMAKAEGWLGKNGSKWQTMPELMLRYRSATFFGRLYAPEVLMGMRDESEVIDVDATVTPVIERPVIGATVVNGNSGDHKPEPQATHEEPPAKKKGKLEILKPPRKKKEEAKVETKPETPEVMPWGPNAKAIDQKLTETGYTLPELLLVAIQNKWIDPPADFAGLKEELNDVPLASVDEDKLGIWVEEWDSVIADQLELLRKG